MLRERLTLRICSDLMKERRRLEVRYGSNASGYACSRGSVFPVATSGCIVCHISSQMSDCLGSEDGNIRQALNESLAKPASRKEVLRQVFQKTITEDNVISTVTLGKFLFDYLRINPSSFGALILPIRSNLVTFSSSRVLRVRKYVMVC